MLLTLLSERDRQTDFHKDAEAQIPQEQAFLSALWVGVIGGAGDWHSDGDWQLYYQTVHRCSMVHVQICSEEVKQYLL